MNRTIDVSDALMARVQALMLREGRTLSSVVEEGLQLLLDRGDARSEELYTFRPVVFPGEGLPAGVAPHDWDRIAELIYRPFVAE